jgi:SAM-dependent methyltransferase
VTADDVRASTANAYDHIVDDFARRNAEVPLDVAEHRASFIAEVRQGGRVADFGCGPGRDAAHFLTVGLDVVAVDASREMTLRTRRAGVPVARADMRFVPLRHGSLDGIWSAASLLHVPRIDVPRTLRAWWGCLRPSGVLGLATSLGDHEGWEACPYEASTQPTSAPLRRWFVHHDRDALLDLLDAAGFEVVSDRERVSHRRWLQVLARRRDH